MEKILGLFFSKSDKDNIIRLMKISFEHKYLLILSIITLILSIFQSLYLPLKLNDMVQIFTADDVAQAFSNNVFSYFIFLSLNSLFESLHKLSIKLFSLNFIKTIREQYVSSIFKKDIEFFDARKPSDLFSLLTEDIETLTNTSILELFSFIKIISLGIGSIFLMFYYYFKLSFVLIVILPIIGYVLRRRYKQTMKEQKQIKEKRYNSHHIVYESLENMRTIKAFSTEDKEYNKYEIQLQKIMKEQYSFLIKTSIVKCLVFVLFLGSIILIIKFAIYIASKSDIQQDFKKNIFSFVLYSSMFISSINNIGEQIEKIQKSLVIAEKLYKIIDYIPKVVNPPLNEHSFMKINGNIEFKNIQFSYPTKKEVEILNNFNLKIKPGMRLGIVGMSGSGKSTIISLLQRLYNCGNVKEYENPKKEKNENKKDEYVELMNMNGDLDNSRLIDKDGDTDIESRESREIQNIETEDNNIFIDNVNIKLLDIKNFHKQIGYVCQEPPLFNNTILENILYGVNQTPDNYDKDELEKVIKLSKSDFIYDKNLFPKGLDTLVGEKGSQLSGGQKQRIAIARALIKKPKILILDEATSALDAESEFEIQNQIYNLNKDMNIIVVAHRLSSIKNCDNIIVIEHGKIVESGTHKELINLNGKYKELMTKQMSEEKAI